MAQYVEFPAYTNVTTASISVLNISGPSRHRRLRFVKLNYKNIEAENGFNIFILYILNEAIRD